MTHHHLVLDDGARQLVLPIGKEVTVADVLRGLRTPTLARIAAVGIEPRPNVNTRETMEAVWAEIARRRDLGGPVSDDQPEGRRPDAAHGL